MSNFIIFFCVFILVSIIWLRYAYILIFEKKFSLKSNFYIFILLTIIAEVIIFLFLANECSINIFRNDSQDCICKFNDNFQWLSIVFSALFYTKIVFVIIILPSLWISSFWKKSLLYNIVPIALFYLFIILVSYIISLVIFSMLSVKYDFKWNLFDIYQCNYLHEPALIN